MVDDPARQMRARKRPRILRNMSVLFVMLILLSTALTETECSKKVSMSLHTLNARFEKVLYFRLRQTIDKAENHRLRGGDEAFETALEMKAHGAKLWSLTNYTGAAQYFTAALKLLNNCSTASILAHREECINCLNNRAASFFKLNEYDAAISDSTEALSLDPANKKATPIQRRQTRVCRTLEIYLPCVQYPIICLIIFFTTSLTPALRI